MLKAALGFELRLNYQNQRNLDIHAINAKTHRVYPLDLKVHHDLVYKILLKNYNFYHKESRDHLDDEFDPVIL